MVLLNLCPGGHKIYNFVWSFLSYHNRVFSLFNLCPGEKSVKEIMQFHYLYEQYGLNRRTPVPGLHYIYNFCRPLVGHQYHIHVLHLSDPCPSVDKKRRRNILLTIWPCPSSRTTAPGVMIFTILVDPSMVIITILFSSFDLCLDVEKKLTKIMHFHYMRYMATP